LSWRRSELMYPELEDYVRQIEEIRQEARRLTCDLTEESFHWRDEPHTWSIGQCFTHLNLLDSKDLPLIAAAMEQGRAAGWLAPGPFRYGWFSRVFLGYTEPPVRIRIKAPGIYVPPPDEPMAPVMEQFFVIRDKLLDLVRRADGLDLARIRVPTPYGRLISFSLGIRFALVNAHNRRHLSQVRGVRRRLGLPA
jgi:DinB superfamily